jgi:hypothetical protein
MADHFLPHRKAPVKRAAFACLLAFAAAGCRSRANGTTPPAARPSFRADIEPVLARHCASADGCHGEHPTHSVSLDLRSGHSYAALVGAPAKTRVGAVRVVPRAPERSFLIDKLTGTLAFAEGKLMPLDPETGAPPEQSPLPATFLDGDLRAWIIRGAPDD